MTLQTLGILFLGFLEEILTAMLFIELIIKYLNCLRVQIGMFRAIISLILWPLWFSYLLVIFPIFLVYTLIVNKKYFHFFLSPMSHLFCFLGGQLVKKTGLTPDPEKGPYLYLINHQSLFDHFALGKYMNHYVTAVAKQ